MTLSKTQQAVLDCLLEKRFIGEQGIPLKDARAIGGLSPKEKLIEIGIYPDGEWFGVARVKGGSIKTLYALHSAGLVGCEDGIWFATGESKFLQKHSEYIVLSGAEIDSPLREKLCTPMTVGQASAEVSKSF